MKAIYERETKAHFNGIVAFAFIAFLMLFVGIFTTMLNLLSLYPNFEYSINSISFIFMIVIPVLTMRTIADERKQKTDQLLYSLPVSLAEVVIGKYLALLTVLIVPIGIMCFYPLILSLFGEVMIGAAYGTILAFFLLGATLLSMGLFVSALTDNQAMAAVLCFIIMLVNFYLSDLSVQVPGTANASLFALAVVVLLLGLVVKNLTQSSFAGVVAVVIGEGILCIVRLAVPSALEGLFANIMKQLSVYERFYSFVAGEFDLAAIVYFITVIAVFLFLTVQTMEKRRWS